MPTALEKSIALTRATREVTTEAIAPEQSRAVAAAISAAEIPLPPGLDTATTLDWPGQSGFGPVTVTDVRDLLQANAAFDWVWFAAAAELTGDHREIVTQIPDWPRFRGSHGLGARLREVFTSALAGDRTPAQDFAATQFRQHGGRPPPPIPW
jgi:hypothetical protein